MWIGSAVQQDSGQEDRLPHDEHSVHADTRPWGRGGRRGSDHEQNGRRKPGRLHAPGRKRDYARLREICSPSGSSLVAYTVHSGPKKIF